MKRYKTVDEFIRGVGEWNDELVQLRKILASTQLEETVKWGGPVYTYNGKNVVGLGSFKSYFGLWFFQGALLKDYKQRLVNCQEGRTKAMRQWRMNSKKDIDPRTIKAYVTEAIELVKHGIQIKPDRNKPLTIPSQLKKALSKNKKANDQFKQLTKGKQREYADYIAEAKREETKQKRLDKIMPMISSGKGLNDKYRNC